MVEVTGIVGRLASVGVVGRKREGRDGSPMTATGIRSNPRRTFLQAIDVLLGERVTLLTDLAHGGPRVVEFSGGGEVASDVNEGTNKGEEDSNTEKSERGRVGDHSNEKAREISTSENTWTRGSTHKVE